MHRESSLLLGYIGQFLDGHPVPQPDNAEYLLNKSPVTQEACVSVNNNWYSDGITWHDTVKMALFELTFLKTILKAFFFLGMLPQKTLRLRG